MKEVSAFDLKFNKMISVLETAINVSEIAIYDKDKGYPYAAGYSRAAMQEVLDTLKGIVASFKE